MRYLLLLLTLCTADAATIVARRGGSPPVTSFPTTGLVSYWRLEEGYSAAGAYDAHGSNDLTAVNTPGAASTGVLGYARDFENTSSQSFTSSHASGAAGGDFSFSFWAQLETTTTSFPACGEWDTGNKGWIVFHSSTTDWTLQISTDGTNNHGVTSSPTSTTTGVWYCVQGYVTTNETAIRVNGEAWNTASFTGSGFYASTAGLSIGDQTNFSNDFDGLIDDVAIWSRKLTDAEFGYVYNSGSGNRLDYAVPTSNLVSYYTLDETSGDASDSHGSNTLTESGGVGTGSGILGSARTFDGSTQYLSAANNTIFDFTSDCFISCWINADSVGLGEFFFGKRTATTGYTANFSGSGSFPIQGFAYTGAGLRTALSSTVASIGTWYHVGFHYDSGSNYISCWVNGVRTLGNSTGAPNSSTGTFIVGSYLGTSLFFDGLIDEMAVYNGSVDPGQIAELYGSGTPPSY